MKALLALEDGRIFNCRSFTGHGETSGEIVFNTGMTGYQEILTDPSYRGQIVTMTYPLIGNYGVNPQDVESDRIQASAFIIKEYQNIPSNFRSTSSLGNYLKSSGPEGAGILGIENMDTRALTRHIRNLGAMRAFISTRDLNPDSCIQKAGQAPGIKGMDLAKTVTRKKPCYWEEGAVKFFNDHTVLNSSAWKYKGKKPSVAVFDFGVKYNILRCLENAGFEIIIVPASTGADTIKAMDPDGIFLSNGPGDPEPMTYAVETIRNLLGFRPMFGICLGHQLIGLALDGKTYKLKFGHRGANQPVKNLETGRIEITSQNHGFAIDSDSLEGNKIEITHINLNDNTIEGFRRRDLRILAVQYHPEASPGPHDANYMFMEFNKMMKE